MLPRFGFGGSGFGSMTPLGILAGTSCSVSSGASSSRPSPEKCVVLAPSSRPARGWLWWVWPATAPAAPILVGSVRYVVTSREVEDMVVLWVHGIAATGWILGLLLLLASATAGSGSLAPEARRRLARWYRRWGFPLVWLAAATVVATGIYNVLRVTPFDLVWRPGDFGELSQVSFGRLYEGILLVKLLLFALMLASGAGLARRAHRVWSEDVAAGDGVLRLGLRRLGVYGVVFVVSAPLIVAAAVALRYVHILSHVAESSGS